MSQLSDAQIAQAAIGAGFRGNGLLLAIAVSLAESGGVTDAVNYNRNAQGSVLSVDRGLWQINNVYHAEVSTQCANNPQCAASAAFRISASGSNWTPWTTYNSGAYRQFMSRAQAASTGGSPATPSPQGSPPPTTPGNAVGATTQTVGFNLTGSTLAYTPTSSADMADVTVVKYGTGDSSSAFKLILAYLVMGVFLWMLSKTKAGYTAVYLALALILFFLFATQAQFFRQTLLPLNPKPAGS